MDEIEKGQSSKKEVARQTLELLRPHFTFNVLNQIKYQIGKNPELAQEMVYDLANFYRGGLTLASFEEETSLDEELRAFKSYLRLESTMNKNMKVVLDLAHEKGVRHRIVKPGLLQHFGEMLVKEEVRTTKEDRTLVVTDGLVDDHYYIQVEIKELGQTINRLVPCLEGE